MATTIDMAGALPSLDEVRAALQALLTEEAATLKQAMLPEHLARLKLALSAAGRWALGEARGEHPVDAAEREALLIAVLLDYQAIAVMVLARASERFSGRVAQYLGSLARQVALGVLGGAVGGPAGAAIAQALGKAPE